MGESQPNAVQQTSQQRQDNMAAADLLREGVAGLSARDTAAVSESPYYSIGELAERFQVTTRALRFYEERGLLHPFRQRKWRLYSHYDVERLKLILMGKRVGLAISEIQEILERHDQGASQSELLGFILEKLEEQADFLRTQRSEIEESLSQLAATTQVLQRALTKNGPRSRATARSSRPLRRA